MTITPAPVTALIADDEPIAREGLSAMLAAHSWIAVIGEAANGPATLEALERLKPELLFLDIQMPGLTGPEVLRQATHHPVVVFTTAFAQHAVTAFELGALDYLLKPFGAERLGLALERVRSAFGEPNPGVADRLAEAMASGPMSRLFVRSGASILPVGVETISRFEAWGDYVTAHAGRSRHVIHLALNRLEERLDASRFLRVHRAHIVNLAHVRAFRPAGKGRLVAEMLDGSVVPVSRSKAQGLRELGS
ncbi:MAG: response regulator transcription factor [Cytophagaceae bacterium]|nr:response regulator transcription factor [Gemmatimonadaceae bacterium]